MVMLLIIVRGLKLVWFGLVSSNIVRGSKIVIRISSWFFKFGVDLFVIILVGCGVFIIVVDEGILFDFVYLLIDFGWEMLWVVLFLWVIFFLIVFIWVINW